jgi:hypothetical protein
MLPECLELAPENELSTHVRTPNDCLDSRGRGVRRRVEVPWAGHIVEDVPISSPKGALWVQSGHEVAHRRCNIKVGRSGDVHFMHRLVEFLYVYVCICSCVHVCNINLRVCICIFARACVVYVPVYVSVSVCARF